MRRALPLALALLSACGGGGGDGGGGGGNGGGTGPTATQYQNPVLNADFPDPSVVLTPDGWYYAYATQTTGRRVQVARSRNLVTWAVLADAMPSRPAWASQSNNFWAPDVSLHAGTYYMYFSTQVDAASRPSAGDDFCIGVATSTTPGGPFIDSGAPLACGPSFTTIDPMSFDDPQSGKTYLYWGSAGSPIKVRELAADRRSFAAGSAAADVVPVNQTGNGYDTGLIEGPWVTWNAATGYYYLYFSGNGCCGAGAHYAVMVARATSPTGPFEVKKITGSQTADPILRANSRWLAPGHNAIATDAVGQEWMLYHAIDVNHPYLIAGNTSISRRPMLLDRITWANDWPVVGTNGTPTTTPQERPTITP